MHRTLETELMDTPVEAMAYDEMDHAEVNRAFVDDLLKEAADLVESGAPGEARFGTIVGLPLHTEMPNFVEVLDLGTGTAQIPIELCRRCEAVRVLAVDAAASMLDVAIANIDIAGLRERVRLDRIDAKSLPYADGRFPVVMSNSIVHHIAKPLSVLQEAHRVTRSGGLLFFRDLLRPGNDADVRQLVETYAGSANLHQQTMFSESLRAALSLDEIQALVAQMGFPAESVRQTSDRHWTWSARVS